MSQARTSWTKFTSDIFLMILSDFSWTIFVWNVQKWVFVFGHLNLCLLNHRQKQNFDRYKWIGKRCYKKGFHWPSKTNDALSFTLTYCITYIQPLPKPHLHFMMAADPNPSIFGFKTYALINLKRPFEI